MKTVFVIMSVLIVVGLVAGVVVPPESDAPSELTSASLAPPAEELEAPVTQRLFALRVAATEGRDVANPETLDAPSIEVPLDAPERGMPVPVTDLFGVMGLLGGAGFALYAVGRARYGGTRVHPRHRQY